MNEYKSKSNLDTLRLYSFLVLMLELMTIVESLQKRYEKKSSKYNRSGENFEENTH